MKSLDQLRQEIRSVLASWPNVELVWIYGSYAMGRARPESDIDIAVAGRAPLTIEERIEVAQTLERTLGLEVDLVDLTQERGVIASQVLTGGRLIYSKSSVRLAALIKRLWFDRADVWPTRDRIFRKIRRKAFGS